MIAPKRYPSAAEKIKVTVLILNWNGKKLLEIILPSVYKLKSRFSYEVIVNDNASTDDSIAFIKKNFPKIRIVQNDKNYGMAGLNYAIPHCRGEYILFMGNDMELEPDSMDKLVEVLDKDETVAYALPRLMSYYDHSRLDTGADWMSRCFYNGKLTDTDNSTVIESAGGGTGLIRKSIIPRIGYFYDQDFFAACEDVDIGLRIRLAGFRTVYVPASVMYHMESATLRNMYRRPGATYLAERNSLMIFYKVPSFHNLVLFFPYVYSMRFAAMLKDIIFRIDFATAFARLKAIFWILLHFPLVWKKRVEIQKLRKARDSYVFRNFTEKYMFHMIR